MISDGGHQRIARTLRFCLVARAYSLQLQAMSSCQNRATHLMHLTILVLNPTKPRCFISLYIAASPFSAQHGPAGTKCWFHWGWIYAAQLCLQPSRVQNTRTRRPTSVIRSVSKVQDGRQRWPAAHLQAEADFRAAPLPHAPRARAVAVAADIAAHVVVQRPLAQHVRGAWRAARRPQELKRTQAQQCRRQSYSNVTQRPLIKRSKGGGWFWWR